MTILNLSKDSNGFNTFGRKPSLIKKSATITMADGEITFTVPSDYSRWEVLFSFQGGASIWVSVNQTAATPVASSFSDTTSELNPAVYELNAGDVVHCITTDTSAQIGVSLYALI